MPQNNFYASFSIMGEVSRLGQLIAKGDQLTPIVRHIESMVNSLGIEPSDQPEFQEVFIEPVYVHAFVKLQSYVAALSNALFLNDLRQQQLSVKRIYAYLDIIKQSSK